MRLARTPRIRTADLSSADRAVHKRRAARSRRCRAFQTSWRLAANKRVEAEIRSGGGAWRAADRVHANRTIRRCSPQLDAPPRSSRMRGDAQLAETPDHRHRRRRASFRRGAACSPSGWRQIWRRRLHGRLAALHAASTPQHTRRACRPGQSPVLAGGLDHPYPPQNLKLYDAHLRTRGCH